jgi:hypothetical protein
MVKSPVRAVTAPTGVMTAAVPQANVSVIEPSATPDRHSSTLIRRSVTVCPSSRATVISDSRVMPGSRVPVSSGVTSSASSPEPRTKNRFIPPISST